MDDVVVEETNKIFGEKVFKKGDKRIHDAMKSLILQAFFFSSFGEGFCDVVGCRLYNPHWQEEAIFSLVKNEKEIGLCNKHYEMLKGLKS